MCKQEHTNLVQMYLTLFVNMAMCYGSDSSWKDCPVLCQELIKICIVGLYLGLVTLVTDLFHLGLFSEVVVLVN